MTPGAQVPNLNIKLLTSIMHEIKLETLLVTEQTKPCPGAWRGGDMTFKAATSSFIRSQ